MEYFQRAKSIRLRSYHHKYLLADDDAEHVSQDRQSTLKNARWTVEFDPDYDNVIRLKSCFNRYLTASEDYHLLGATGQKVIQTVPKKIDSSVIWEPVLEGSKIRLKSRYGNYLRANGGVPPWRNSVTHDIPHRHHNWILWDVEIVEVNVDPPKQISDPDPDPDLDLDDSSSFQLTSDPNLGSDQSFGSSRSEGRMIYYKLADDDGGVVDAEGSFLFKGKSVEDLTQNLEEETELENITVCSINPLNGMLYPLRLALPPNNTTMHVIVVPATSKDDIFKRRERAFSCILRNQIDGKQPMCLHQILNFFRQRNSSRGKTRQCYYILHPTPKHAAYPDIQENDIVNLVSVSYEETMTDSNVNCDSFLQTSIPISSSSQLL